MKFLKLPKRAFGELWIKGRKDSRSGLYQDDTRRRWIDVAKVAPKCEACEFGYGPGHFDSGRARPDDHKGQRLPALFIVASLFSNFESQEHAAPDLESVFNAFETGRLIFPLIVTEVMVTCPGRHNQVVIFESQVLRDDFTALRIDLFNLVENDSDIALIAKNTADRLRDIRWRQFGSGYLVKKGLKKVVIAPVNKNDLDGSIGEGLRGAKSRKSSSNDYNDWQVCFFVRRGNGG